MLSFGRGLNLPGLATAWTLLVAISPAVASPLPLLDIRWPGLNHEDVKGLGEASQNVLQLASQDAVVQWQNPDSHHSGIVRRVGSFEAHGMPCRVLDYTIRYEELGNALDHYVVNWCRLPDGEWKIAELAP